MPDEAFLSLLPLPLIASFVGKTGYRNLYPFIFAGRLGRDASYEHQVLYEVDINEFLLTPFRINLDGSGWKFFEKCLFALNPYALYLEGLRIVTHGGSLENALIYLLSAGGSLKYGIFATTMGYFCCGQNDNAMSTMEFLCRTHPTQPLNKSAELAKAVEIAETIFRKMNSMRPARNGRFMLTWNYHPIPSCLCPCELEICECVIHCRRNVCCPDCFFYWTSKKMCELC